MWEIAINIHDVKVIRTATNTFFGCGAINSIDSILEHWKKRDIYSVLVVTGRSSAKLTGAWDRVEKSLKANNFRYTLFDGVTPNPTCEQVELAAALGRSISATAVIAIGGGSPIDAGKTAAILLRNPGKTAKQLYNREFTPTQAAPITAINLTHGTGSEVNRFAVITIPEQKHKGVIAFDCIYPEWAIDDPALMTDLSQYQTRFVSVDAVNHVLEAATSKAASPFTILLARQTIELVAKYLPLAVHEPKNLTARYYLLYASMLAGIAFDNGLLHYTHALEHPLSAVKPELSHGLGLAMILPAVIEEIYPKSCAVLADLLFPLIPDLHGTPGEARKAAQGVEKWLFENGITHKLADEGFHKENIDELVDLTFQTPSLADLLASAPTTADRDSVTAIFAKSMYPLI